MSIALSNILNFSIISVKITLLLSRYSRACGSYQNFLDRGVLLTRKLLNLEFLSWSHHFESFTVATMTWLTVVEYLCHKWTRVCSTCRKHFPVLSSFMSYHGFVTRLTRRVPLVEQELLILLEHTSSPPFFSGVCVTRSLVLRVYFVDRCLSFCASSSIYRFNLFPMPYSLTVI